MRDDQNQSKMRRSVRRKRARLFYRLGVIALTSGLVLLMPRMLFRIEQIQVIGTDRYHPDEIIEASGLHVGDNLFDIDAGAVKNAILVDFPYVSSVDIKRRFPPKVEIYIEQNTPELAAYMDGNIAYLTMDGKILEIGDLFVAPDLPIIKGLDINGALPGMYVNEISEDNAERLNMLQYVFEAAKSESFGEVTNVDLSDRLNMTIMYQARVFIILGSEWDLEYKFRFVKTIIEDLDPYEQARIDVANISSGKVYVKSGKVESGVFYSNEYK